MRRFFFEKTFWRIFFVFFFSLENHQRSSDISTSTYDFDDERRALREELERFRRENDVLRRSFQTSASIDSGVETNLSNTLKSSTALQVEVKELREREGKLLEEIQSLKRVRRKSFDKTSSLIRNVFKATSNNVFNVTKRSKKKKKKKISRRLFFDRIFRHKSN